MGSCQPSNDHTPSNNPPTQKTKSKTNTPLVQSIDLSESNISGSEKELNDLDEEIANIEYDEFASFLEEIIVDLNYIESNVSMPPELQSIREYLAENGGKDRKKNPQRSDLIPFTIERLINMKNKSRPSRTKSPFEFLKFRSDDDLFQLPGDVDEYDYSQCPNKDEEIIAYFDKLATLRVTSVQIKERILGIARHHFSEITSDNHMIYIDFWSDSTLTVSIWTKPYDNYSDYKVISKKREVEDNLRYWVRKAISRWSRYSLLLWNCQDQAYSIITPVNRRSHSPYKITSGLTSYFSNLPKNLLKVRHYAVDSSKKLCSNN